jgi:small-conductance mechanosensitive channel
LGILLIGRVWFQGFDSISTYLGLLSAGLAVALQTPIVNFVGWIFLISRRPFEVGDRIEIDGNRGDIVDMRIFNFTMMEIGNWVDADQSTGRIIHVPNGKVFTESIANYNKGFDYIWDEIPILLTFESDWKKAKSILERIAQQHELDDEAVERVRQAAERYLIFYQKLTPIVYTSVKDSGVLLTIRYLTQPRKRRTTQEKIWESILDAFFAESAIDFAYPTTRFYSNGVEGKSGAGGPIINVVPSPRSMP